MPISFSGAKNYKKHNGFSETSNIKTPLPSPIHYYSLTQNDNLMLEPIVHSGERVLRGEKIADLNNFSAIPCISSVSGKILSVTKDMITVENDFLDEEYPNNAPDKTPDELTSRELLWLIREGGVIEPRTGIPAHVLLAPDKVPQCVIVCCFSSDPYVSSPQTATIGNAEKIMSGLNIVLRLLCVKKAFIAVESTAKKTFSDFKYLLRYNKNILLYSLKPRYPQSRRDILIKTVTGKSESDIKAVILSAETLCNIADAVYRGKCVTEKTVTVSGDDILEPSNFNVPIGASISTLLLSAGYNSPQTVIMGGIIDGTLIYDTEAPVTASTDAVIAFNNKENIPKYRKEPI